MKKTILSAGLAVALTIAGLPASAAMAGRYHVYSCRTPNGGVAPVDGWSGVLAPGGAYDDYALNTCPQGGALVAALGDKTKHAAGVDNVVWEFAVPSGRTLVGASVQRAGGTAGGAVLGASYQYWLASPVKSKAFDECSAGLACTGHGDISSPFAEENRIVIPAERLGAHIYAVASCGGELEFECPAGKGDANGYAAALYLYAADLTLEQTAGPSVSATGGELTSAPSIAGTTDLTFNATDPGAGVYEAVFTVDGSVVQRTVINEAEGRCRDVGQTTDGLPAFLYLQPCPASVSADVGFDASKLTNGSHHLTVSVLDAAGNSAPVLDRTVTVANPGVPGPPNGVGTVSGALLEAHWQGSAAGLLKSSWGRSRTIVGRLLGGDGLPITGASIEASYTAEYTGAHAAAISGTRTGPGGVFTLTVPGGVPSSRVLLAYRARVGDAAAEASGSLQLSVPAAVALRVHPRVSGAGRRIFFQGRLPGLPIPRGGKAVILEARSGRGSWIEFKVLRTDSRGRFHAAYRFRFPGPVRYQFRVLCEHEADYPFGTGASKPVSVLER